jgi:tetratricopeptide (TPR) repeat protein
MVGKRLTLWRRGGEAAARRLAGLDLPALAARLRAAKEDAAPVGTDAQGVQPLLDALDELRRRAGDDAAGIAEAFARLEAGDSAAAAAIFRAAWEAKAAEIAAARRQAAEAARHYAALAGLHDHDAALAAYVEAARLEPEHAEGWNRLGLAQARAGRLSDAEASFKQLLALGQAAGDDALVALAAGNLGLVALLRGDLDQAEAQIRQSLACEAGLGEAGLGEAGLGEAGLGEAGLGEAAGGATGGGAAVDFGNLGLLYRRRGELELAEVMHRRALAIEERLGRRGGVADQYGHLGLLHQQRGDLDQAEAMLQQALALNESLGRRAQAAAACGHLGMIARERGQPERALALHRRALAHDEALGRGEGVAVDCTNLGILHEELGDQPAACAAWQRAARLYAELGQPGKVLQLQGWLKAAGCASMDDLLVPPQETPEP